MRSAAAILILLLAGQRAPAAGKAPGGEQPTRFEYQQVLMGVPVKILVYASDEAVANAAVHAAFDRIRQLNLIFSDYDEDSEISRLCHTSGPGRPVRVSPEPFVAPGYSPELRRRTDRAFDSSLRPP